MRKWHWFRWHGVWINAFLVGVVPLSYEKYNDSLHDLRAYIHLIVGWCFLLLSWGSAKVRYHYTSYVLVISSVWSHSIKNEAIDIWNTKLFGVQRSICNLFVCLCLCFYPFPWCNWWQHWRTLGRWTWLGFEEVVKANIDSEVETHCFVVRIVEVDNG